MQVSTWGWQSISAVSWGSRNGLFSAGLVCSSSPLQGVFFKTAGGKKGLKIFPLCSRKSGLSSCHKAPTSESHSENQTENFGANKERERGNPDCNPSQLENVIWISRDQNGKCVYAQVYHLAGTNGLICCDNSVFSGCARSCQSPGGTHGLILWGSECQAWAQHGD